MVDFQKHEQTVVTHLVLHVKTHIHSSAGIEKTGLFPAVTKFLKL